MSDRTLGPALADWRAPPPPGRPTLAGRWCRVEPLWSAHHARDLFEANAADYEGRMWDYLAYGPFADFDAYAAWIGERELSVDPLFFAFVDLRSGRAVGVGAYLRIDPANGAIEVGHLAYSPQMQRTVMATEAMYLLLRHAFDLGYRRYEWKCNALNTASRRAAGRLGFRYEGTFRQHMVVKGRNRDTAWYSILDGEWPAIRTGYERWLDRSNLDADGRQRRSLAEARAWP
jgi:RimJ/RimL family protein N-acetyltransferase